MAGSARAEPRPTLIFTSWGGGIYSNSMLKAFLIPFAEATGDAYRLDEWGAELSKLEAVIDSKRYPSMVYEMGGLGVQQACDAGLLAETDYALFGGADAYLPGATNHCGLGFLSWSYVYGYRVDAFGGRRPQTVMDFFDLEKFPGGRALPRSSFGIMEMALLADGVPPADIYRVLATDEGLERAITKLDTIRPAVRMFWTAFSQPAQLLVDGEVVMSIAPNGRIDLAKQAGMPVDLVWHGQVLDYGFLTIPAGLPDFKLASRFLEFVSTPKVMAGFSRFMAYGPTRLDAFAYIDGETAARLPTAPQNLAYAVTTDPKFWSANIDRVERRYLAWMSQPY